MYIYITYLYTVKVEHGKMYAISKFLIYYQNVYVHMVDGN